MQVPFHSLSAHLGKKPMLPLWLVSGDEPLLVQEALAMLRAAVMAQGTAERKVFHIEGRVNWKELRQAAGTSSLFVSKRLFELRFSKPSLDKEAATMLPLCLPKQGDDLYMILSMPKLAAKTTKSKWYLQVAKQGAHVPIWPVELKKMPAWVAARMKKRGLKLTPQATEFFLSCVEGNLLAADQEITKMAVLDTNQTWSAEAVASVLGDASRYSVFDLLDAMLAGQMKASCKMLAALQQEGEFPLRVLAMLCRELATLQAVCKAVERGASRSQAMSQHGVFRHRVPLVGEALQTLTSHKCEQLLARLCWVDQSVKGLISADPWALLRDVLVGFAADDKELPGVLRASQMLCWRA